MGRAKAKAKPRVLTFDEHGDLRLEIGQDEKKEIFVVCSRALARVSNPFKAMLYGCFAESKSRKMDPNWTVKLPEDDPEAFATLMIIVHGNFGMVPFPITRDHLFQITILTDKYDMTEVLRPWAHNWIQQFTAMDLNTTEGAEDLLWIAWELGHTKFFLHVLAYLSDGLTVDDDGTLRWPFGHRVMDNILCGNLLDWGTLSSSCLGQRSRNTCTANGLRPIESIAALRVEGIAKMLSCLETAKKSLMAPGNSKYGCQLRPRLKREQIHNGHTGECQLFHLGSFMMSLKASGFFPPPSASSFKCSLSTLRSDLILFCDNIKTMESLKGMAADPDYQYDEFMHNKCSPGTALKESINSVTLELSLAEHEKKHLSQQAARSGVLDKVPKQMAHSRQPSQPK